MTAELPLPFPWTFLDATRQADVATLRDVRRWVEGHVRVDAFAQALREIVGTDLNLIVRRARPWMPSHDSPGSHAGIGVLLASADDAPTSPRAFLEVEPALAAALVARTIRRPPPVVVDGARTLSPATAGALAGVLAAAARRACSSLALRVLSAGDAGTMDGDVARLGSDLVALTLTVLVADDAFHARLVVSPSAAFAVPEVPWTSARLSALGAMPLSLPVVACATRATAADVAVLLPGDVWFPGTWGLDAPTGARGAALLGPVVLAPPASEAGVRARLVEGGRLVLSGEMERLCEEEAMVESDGESALLNAVGDVPVLVRVEIGEASMTARQWASLGRGDVVTLGKRVGGQVLLRVGGVPVAFGELVSVDGEVGVRIAERVGGDPTSA